MKNIDNFGANDAAILQKQADRTAIEDAFTTEELIDATNELISGSPVADTEKEETVTDYDNR